VVIDGGASAPVAPNGEIGVTGDGPHLLAITASDGSEVNVYVPIDATAPVVSCGTLPTVWTATDVSAPCTSTDATSGPDTSFLLGTAVPGGTADAAATAGPRAVCDLAGNCANAQLSGAKVDKVVPAVDLISPSSGATYTVGTVVAVTPSCSDVGSGLVAGPAGCSAGGSVDTTTPGTKSFIGSVTATDVAGNTVTQPVTVSYTVAPAVTGPTPFVRAVPRNIRSASNTVSVNAVYVAVGPGPYHLSVRWTPAGPFVAVPDAKLPIGVFTAATTYPAAGSSVATVQVCTAANRCGTDTVHIRTG